MEAATASRESTDKGLARVVAAARSCFARGEARRTRMAAIADEAGMARQTLYAFVSSKDELLELVLAERLLELSDTIVSRLGTGGDLADALVERLAVITEVVRSDGEFLNVSEALGPAEAFRFMTGPSAAQQAALRAMEPYYERACDEGALRSGVTLDDMATWTRAVCSPLTARHDLGPVQLREWLAKFALPAMLSESHLTPRGR